jgi:regulator of PEP synthase PpsR (kinase-PPPase family)
VDRRTIFFVSDQTGITAETLGQSLLTQFDDVKFKRVVLPFLNTLEKAEEAKDQINRLYQNEGVKPVVFCTFIDDEVRDVIKGSNCAFFDFFEAFIAPLEKVLDKPSSHATGQSHGMVDGSSYKTRIDAVNFALKNDDGANITHYDEADIILVGVSRSGKTPTCLYLALQFGINAANYPLTEEDLDLLVLPPALKKYKKKLYGLTIDPNHLQRIRQERRPDSRYCALKQCVKEVGMAEDLLQLNQLPFLNTTTVSIEEISTTILQEVGLQRHLY